MGKLDKFNKILEIPRELISKAPKITITNFDEILIENFKSILEYENSFVKIDTHVGNVNVAGKGLILSQMTEDDILVSGKIETLDFERKRRD